ncbi:phosphatase PAP2 family protein [Paraburkholderia sediminicola]|uniref:phosphatase PAP2 family protein n=1 Tax=Paraburkholderia sediminicola TaxID=458836 RepID=UPI0038B8F782
MEDLKRDCLASSTGLTRFTSPAINLGWAVFGAIVLVDAIWLAIKRWTFVPESLIAPLAVSVVFGMPLLVGRYRRDPALRRVCEVIPFLALFTAASATLSYLVVATAFPLVDAQLAAADRFIGFDWVGYYSWAQSHPLYLRVIGVAYESMGAQIFLIAVYLSFSSRFLQLFEYIRESASTLLLAIVVSVFWPAQGALKFYGDRWHADVSQMFHFELLRSGAMTIVDLRHIEGLVSMPSYHTISAILLCWAVRRTPLVHVVVPVNIAMVLATPIVGGHYVVDVLGGAIVAAAAIALFGRGQPVGRIKRNLDARRGRRPVSATRPDLEQNA